MKIGNYEVFSIETGRFGLDGGAMFGVVPKTLWSKKIPSDPYNRINLASRTLLIFYKDRKILVDVGCGHKFSEKQQKIPKKSTSGQKIHQNFFHFLTSSSIFSFASSEVASWCPRRRFKNSEQQRSSFLI